MITPKKFAYLLKNSSLEADLKLGILDVLPFLEIKEIQEIAHILEQDVTQGEALLVEADEKFKMLTAPFLKQAGEE